MKFSIVIPTMTRSFTEELIETVFKYTTMKDVEVIVVSNGMKDENLFIENVKKYNINILSFPEPLGVPRAYNEGIKVANGEYIILLNDDCAVLDSPKDAWINMLYEPYKSGDKISVTGPYRMTPQLGMNNCSFTQENMDFGFMIFFCVMIPKKLFSEIGLLDEQLLCGIDVDFCLKAKEKGYRIVQVPDEKVLKTGDGHMLSNFPFYHKGEGTVHDFYGMDRWKEILKHDVQILDERYGDKEFNDRVKVSAYISTKNRMDTTLPMAIASAANQTLKPDELVIIDDSDEQKDLRSNPMYESLFRMLDVQKIKWKVIFGQKRGQVMNHQYMLHNAKNDLIWRIDDDNFPESNVLETLVDKILSDDKIGAVASRSTIPNNIVPKESASSLIGDIYTKPNLQWASFSGCEEVDHLHNSFLYRREAGIHGYHMELSPVGHREETMFTYEMKLNGWKLFVIGDVNTWHFRQPQGGIRSYNDESMYEHDEEIFVKWMKNKSIKNIGNMFIAVLDNGIGDHLDFLSLMPEIRKKNKPILLATCYPEVFKDESVVQISIAEAKEKFGNIDKFNVYGFMIMNNWKGTVIDAYRRLYNI